MSLELSEFISPKLTKLELTATTKVDAIKELIDMLNEGGYLSNADEFLQSVLETQPAEIVNAIEKLVRTFKAHRAAHHLAILSAKRYKFLFQ